MPDWRSPPPHYVVTSLNSPDSFSNYCFSGVSRDNVIPLFIRGSEHDPRTKIPTTDEGVPNRPIGHRPEPQVRRQSQLSFYSFHISQELPPLSTATNSGGWNHKHQWSAECTVWRYVIHRWVRLLPLIVRSSVPGTIQPFETPYVWTVPESRDLLYLHPKCLIEFSYTW